MMATLLLPPGPMVGHAWHSTSSIRGNKSRLICAKRRHEGDHVAAFMSIRNDRKNPPKALLTNAQQRGYDIARSKLRKAHSSSGLGHRPLKAEITGSNPVCATYDPPCCVYEPRSFYPFNKPTRRNEHFR